MHTQALASLATVAGAWAERVSSDPDATLFRQVRLSAAEHADCPLWNFVEHTSITPVLLAPPWTCSKLAARLTACAGQALWAAQA